MALSQRLDLRQTQSLVMTPQLQQAIKLLQMSNMELSEFVDRELEQNPLLEREDAQAADSGGAGGEGEANGWDAEAAPAAEPPASLDPYTADSAQLTASEGAAGFGDGGPLDTDYENVWTHASASENGTGGDEAFGTWSNRGGGTGFDNDLPGLDQTLSTAISLRDHLLEQLHVDVQEPADRLIGSALIDSLDEAGYLRADLEQLAQQFDCGPDQVERVLATLQRFDPTGICARSLQECLALQLRERDRLDPAMQALLDNLDLLAARNLPALMRVCAVDTEDLTDMIAELRSLNPRPASAFDHTTVQIIEPDILMRPQPGGGWLIDLNPDTLPRILVNQRYAARVSGAVRGKADRDYLHERMNSANWLVKSLHQRATTILKVATEIVRQQDRFFVHGVRYLKPLILRDIAEAIGMHESTVSRVTSNKFIATPRGIFELKYFFTSAIPGATGREAHSAEAVRFRIKALIEAETSDSILSDDRIVEILRGDGIDIARRTVAKYREGMRIPSSVQRRREKALRL